MQASFIQDLFSLITNNIFYIIYAFAAIEVYLIVSIYRMMRAHELVLLDVSDNLLKGFPDSPDSDSSKDTHEKIQAALDFISQKVATEPEKKKSFAENAASIGQKSLYARHYKIETFASVISTLVQVFPLLGILGTILAIAQTAFQNGGQVDVSSISNAFVLAMDTTILGITFSILFMVIESAFQPKIERVISESSHYKKIVTAIHLS